LNPAHLRLRTVGGMLRDVDLWQVGLIAVIVIGLGLIIFGALWDRSRNRRRAAEMLAPPPRRIPQFRPDAPAPHYLSDLQARRRPADARTAALTAEDRETILRQIADAQTVTVSAGYASKDFVTDPTSGWAVLDRPAVLVCADPVETIRELLGVLEQLIMSRTPLVVVAPSLAPEVLGTLEVNQIRQTMKLLAVTPDATELSALATACGATIMDRADLRSGYAPPDHLGRCERWVSTPKASHLIMSAEVSQTA
jgi:hypothetical protein